VFDHLATHVDAQPLFVGVQLIAIEHLPQSQVTLYNEPCQAGTRSLRTYSLLG
jgi:hypothetical protein